jgi:hypothetical protein
MKYIGDCFDKNKMWPVVLAIMAVSVLPSLLLAGLLLLRGWPLALLLASCFLLSLGSARAKTQKKQKSANGSIHHITRHHSPSINCCRTSSICSSILPPRKCFPCLEPMFADDSVDIPDLSNGFNTCI